MTDKTGPTDNFFAKLMNFLTGYGFQIMVLRLAGLTYKEIIATILHNFFFHFRNRILGHTTSGNSLNIGTQRL